MIEDRSYHAFWSRLVLRSNRRTDFSIRRATKRSWIAFDLVGFRFSYRIDQKTPNAYVFLSIVRSDADSIYQHMLRHRIQIEQAFGGPLRWLSAAPVPENSEPSPALCATIASPPLKDLPQEQWEEVQCQMIDAMARLEDAVTPQVQSWLPDW